MEKELRPNLQKIFNFSNVLWILQYYSHLDKWRFLLAQLNSNTNKTWERNKEAFIKFGERHKRDVFMNNTIASNFDKFNKDSILFEKIFINHRSVYSYLLEIIFQMAVNQELVVYQSEKYENNFELYICHDEESRNLPILNWPYYVLKMIDFNSNQKIELLKYLIDCLKYDLIAVKNSNNQLQLKKWLSPVINVKSVNEIKEVSRERWRTCPPSANWHWEWDIHVIYINMNEFNIKNLLFILLSDLRKLKKLHTMVLSFKNWTWSDLECYFIAFDIPSMLNLKIKQNKLSYLNYSRSFDKTCWLRLAVNQVKVQKDSKTYSIKSECNGITLVWETEVIPFEIIEDKLIVRIWKIDAKNYVISQWKNYFDETFKKALSDKTIYDASVYAVVDIKDILWFETKNVNWISKLNLLDSVKIKYHCFWYEVETKQTSKLLSFKHIEINVHLLYFKNIYWLEFWRIVLSFPLATFRINNKSIIVFQWELGLDPYSCMIPCSIGDKKEIRLPSLISLLVSEILYSTSISDAERK